MAKNPLLKSVFRAQLRAEAPNTIVGKAGSAYHCPIANGLAKLGHPRPVVGLYRLTWGNCTTPPKISKWQRAFIAGTDHGSPIQGSITAARALEILEQV